MYNLTKKELEELTKEWYNKLKKLGFNDIEGKNEVLFQPNRRTIAWLNRDRIRDFFFCLDAYLQTEKDLPMRHRKILEMWTEGIYHVDIAKKLEISVSTVELTLIKYKPIIIDRMQNKDENE